MSGAIYEAPSGRKFFLAHRRLDQIFRSGEKSISEAVYKGTACWAIDDTTLYAMRSKGITLIGVLVRENHDIWLAKLDDFLDRSKAKVLDHEARYGGLQRYLPLSFFKHKPGKIRL